MPLLPPPPEAEREILDYLEKSEGLDHVKMRLLQMLEAGHFSEELWSLYLESLLVERESHHDLLSSDLPELFPFVANVAKAGGVSLSPAFLWRWGLTHYAIGLQGEEPCDFVKAISLLRRAVAYGFEKASLCFDLAKCYFFLHRLVLKRNLLEEALRWLERGERLSGEINEELLPLIRSVVQILFQENPTDEYLTLGLRFFEIVFENEGLEEWMEKGRFFLRAARYKADFGLYQKALDQFQKVEAIGTETTELSLLMGETFLGMGCDGERVDLLREGQNLLEHVSEQYPEFSRPLQLLAEGYFEEGALLQDHALVELSIQTSQEALAVEPDSGEGFWGLARASTLLGEMKTEPSLLEKGSSYYAEAEAHLKEPSAVFYADWGFCLLKLAEITQGPGWIEGAIARLERALAIFPIENPHGTPPSDWLYHLGCAFDLLGDQSMQVSDYEKSIYHLTRALTLDSAHPYVRFNLATALSHLGEATNETECFEKAFELFRSQAERDAEDDIVFAEWGVSLLTFADMVDDPSLPGRKEILFKEAEDRLEWARRLGNLHASYHLACLHSLQGNVEASLYFLKRGEALGALPPLDEILEDEWLETARQAGAFQELIEILRKKKPN